MIGLKGSSGRAFHIHPHMFRRTFARYVARYDTTNLLALKEHFKHISLSMTDYYVGNDLELWMLMEEIFGENSHLGTLAIRINPGGRKSKRKIAAQHEYALYFSKSPATEIAKIFFDPSDKTHSYKLDEKGNWYEERNLRKEGADSLAKEGAERFYPIYFDSNTGKLSTVKKYN